MDEPSITERLRAPLPAEAVKQHPTKNYLSSVNSMYVIERLNDVFGEQGWTAEYKVVEAGASQAMVVVECILRCHPHDDFVEGQTEIVRQTYGGNDNKDRGDAYKGACTDALTKAASQIGIAQDVYKGMYDKELVGDDDKKSRKPRDKKPEYEVVDGIVTKSQRMGEDTLWLEVHGNRIRATDKQTILKLANVNGKRVELRCRWDAIGKNKVPCLSVMNIMGIFEPVPSEPHYEKLQSKCFKHGIYDGAGECPKCAEAA